MEGSEPLLEGRRINSKGRKRTPVHSARSNEMQLTPRILRFIRLLPPPLHFAAFTEHSGQVAMNICIQLWPSKATGQFVRHISPPFPPFLYFLSSFLSFFLFSLALRLLFLPVFRATTVATVVDKRKTAETEGDNPLPLAQRCFDERLNPWIRYRKFLIAFSFFNFFFLFPWIGLDINQGRECPLNGAKIKEFRLLSPPSPPSEYNNGDKRVNRSFPKFRREYYRGRGGLINRDKLLFIRSNTSSRNN